MHIDKQIIKLEKELENYKKNCFDQEYLQMVERILDYYKDNGFLKKTIFYAELLKEQHKEAERYDKLSGILNMLGKCYSQLSETDKAMDYLDEALEISRETGNREIESMCLTNIALLQRKMNKLDDCLESYFKAREIMEDILQDPDQQNNKNLLADYLQVLDQIGVIYNILKQPEMALEYMELSLSKAKETNMDRSIYSTLINLGVYYSSRDLDRSLKYYLEALKYIRKTDDKHILSVVTNNIGGVYEDKGEYKTAQGYYFKALKMAEECEQNDFILFFNKHIGSVYYKQRNYEKALYYIDKSIELAKKCKHTSELEENYHLLSKIYRAMKDYDKALEYSDKYIEIKEKSLSRDMHQHVNVLQKKYEKTKKELNFNIRKTSLISEVLQKKMNLNFIGNSPEIRKVQKLALQAANTPDSNVLITGESGTGKEIIANIIHYASSRHDNMFISVNSGSIPEHLMESAFLGHKKGAFTGAVTDKIGYLVMADKGSLFLDEIGDMPMHLQTKLLRIIENKKFLPVGAEKEIESDFRLITATNKDIDKLIEDNKFRVDLFYRINAIEIRIPPLRDRKEDILPLTKHYLKHYAHVLNKPIPNLDHDLIEFLENYSFPGNVRELKNMMERAMIIIKSDTISPNDLILRNQLNTALDQNSMQLTTLAEMEERLINKALASTGNNVSKAARILGIHYTTLNRKLKAIESTKEKN